MRCLALVVAPVFVLVVATGCTSSQRKALSETAVRNAVAVAGSAEFSNHGHKLDGLLTCTAKAKTTTNVVVACHGQTTDGKAAALLGNANSDDAKNGTYAGTVDGQEVFRKSCLGC